MSAPTPEPDRRDDAAANESAAQLWLKHANPQDNASRNELIEHYSPLVRFVSGRIGATLPNSVDRGDLVSAGMLGLIDAIERFNPELGPRFESFAMARIRGAIMDALRDGDWVPRTVRASARQIEQAIGDLQAVLKRAPTDDEIAGLLSIGIDELFSRYSEMAALHTVALEQVVSAPSDVIGNVLTLGDLVADDRVEDPAVVAERADQREVLARLITHLPERDQIVLALYYYEGFTFAEVGRVLDISESRASQIHARALLSLRSLARYDDVA